MSLTMTEPPMMLEEDGRSDKSVYPSQVEVQQNEAEMALALKERKAALWREIGCYTTCFVLGWTDSSSGPLLPHIQNYFHISYTVVSMLFVGQMVGCVTGSLCVSKIIERFGVGRTVTIGSAIQAAGLIFVVPGWAFPIMPVCYAVAGVGSALQGATANMFIASLPNAEWKLGWLHAFYGLGALVCPLAATAFTSAGIKFSYFYLCSIGVGILNVCVLLYAFRFSYRTDHHIIAPTPTNNVRTDEEDGIELDDLGTSNSEGRELHVAKDSRGALRQALSTWTVPTCAAFLTLYVGAEVSMGGWIVTFLVDNRDAGSKAGYVATAFWGGLMLGRVLLMPVNIFVGEQRVVWLYLGIATALEFAIWFARDFIGNAVAIALVGFVIGPLYPILISVVTKLLPRHLHAAGIGFIAAFGQSGSAIFPFVTGALAQRFSPAVLQPVLVVLFVGQGLIWFMCPKIVRKTE